MSGFFSHYPVFIPLFVLIIANLIKISLRLFDKNFDRRYLVTTGGMPSAHAATVSSMVYAAAAIEGVTSVVFAATSLFAAIVIFDATHIRFEAGKHASHINDLLRLDKKKALNVSLGHTGWQVFVGTLLGVGLAWLFLSTV